MASVSPFTLPRPPARRHPAGLWVILSGILLFVLLATFASLRQNDIRARFEFSQAVDRYVADIERQLRALQVATLSMAAGMEVGTEPVSRARFDRLAAALRQSIPAENRVDQTLLVCQRALACARSRECSG